MAFFDRLSGDELERRYYAIMEEQFQLKHHGRLTLFEQNQLTSEDRAWWMKRLQRYEDDTAAAQQKAQRSASTSRAGRSR